MEAAVHYWLSLYFALIVSAFKVVVTNPIQSDAFRKMYIRQTKNDSVDSCIIAQIMHFGEFSDIYGVTSRNLLSKYPLPEDILSVSTSYLAEILSKSSKGRFGMDKSKEIKKAASKSFGIKFAIKSFSFQIKQIINQIF